MLLWYNCLKTGGANVDTTISLAFIVTFVTIVSQVIVTVLNNRHMRKIKELEIQQQNFQNITIHKRELFENYLKMIGEFSYELTSAKMSELLISYYQILPYIPEEKAKYFRDFADEIGKQDFKNWSNLDYSVLHDEIIPTIKLELEKLQAV